MKGENKKNKSFMKKVIIYSVLILFIFLGYSLFLNYYNDTNSEIRDLEYQAHENLLSAEENKDFSDFGSNKPIKKQPEYNEFSDFFLDTSWNNNEASRFSHTWGEQNIEKLSKQSIKVTYPKGSYKPSGPVQGGAGFIYDIGESREYLSLYYEIELDENFDFVKGGKLAGLCGGTCPRGADDNSQGFSTIFSWKKDGYLDMNIIYPGAKTYGENLPRKIAQLQAGGKYSLQQQIVLNQPGMSDGILTLYVNGEKVFSKNNYSFRNSEDVEIDALIFSSFFAGNDESWSTPNDTSIVFSNFKLIK